MSEDKRREPRIICQKRVEIMRCSSAEGFLSVELVDCSLHGAAFLLDQRLEVGEAILLKLRMPKIALVVGTVRNCRPWKGSWHRSGVEFQELLGDGEHQDFQSAFATLAGK